MLMGALKKAISARSGGISAATVAHSVQSSSAYSRTADVSRLAIPSANRMTANATNGVKISPRFLGAKIWLQPLAPKKLAVQWHLPSEIRRDCGELFAGENANFVLRIYRQAVSGETSRRTLEFEIDVNRRCCYLNLENGDGVFTGEIGLRCDGNRYIFMARSTAIEMLMPINPSASSTPSATVSAKKSTDTQTHPPAAEKKYPSNSDNSRRPIIASPVKKWIHAENEIDWEWRDVVAEEQAAAVYQTFVNEGERGLRRRAPILPSPLPARKIALAARRIPAVSQIAQIAKSLGSAFTANANAEKSSATSLNLRDSNSTSVAETPKRMPRAVLRYPLQAVAPMPTPPTTPTPTPKILRNQNQDAAVSSSAKPSAASAFSGKTTVNVKSQKLTELIGIRDRSEIILRGRVKKIGQRVRVGGLLIEPDADGSFCVACVIRDGKLFVPVVEVEAARIRA